MRVLVCGGREFNNRELLEGVLDQLNLSKGPFNLLIHGGANGADKLSRLWARNRGIPVQVYSADWEKYGRSAGPIRNRQMLLEGHPNLVVAFPGGAGTANMINMSKRARIEVIEVSQPDM